MGKNNLEKLLIDLKNLPKQKAPEDLEEKLFQRISNYQKRLSSGESTFKLILRNYFNPIYVPALTLILVAVLIYYHIEINNTNLTIQTSSLEKATPIIQEQVIVNKEPQKISVPPKSDFVVKRSKQKLNFGPGVSLDEPDFTFSRQNSKQPEFIGFPIPDERIVIRIPPPEFLFNQDIDQMRIPVRIEDSIQLIRNKRK